MERLSGCSDRERYGLTSGESHSVKECSIDGRAIATKTSQNHTDRRSRYGELELQRREDKRRLDLTALFHEKQETISRSGLRSVSAYFNRRMTRNPHTIRTSNLMESLRWRKETIPAKHTRRKEEGNLFCQEQWQNDRTRASDKPSRLSQRSCLDCGNVDNLHDSELRWHRDNGKWF